MAGTASAIVGSAEARKPVSAFRYYALFFASGFPALIYQIVWQRALFTIYGVNIQSVTVIVTVFMLGLGLGSLAGGKLSSRAGVNVLRILLSSNLPSARLAHSPSSSFITLSDSPLVLPRDRRRSLVFCSCLFRLC